MNFQKLWENMELAKQLAKERQQPIEDAALSSIRTGMGISDDFWNDFLLLLNNAKGLGALLDIDPDKISSWAAKIEAARKQVEDSDAAEDVKQNKKMLKTGMSQQDGED
jgi:hypothetical protein